MKRKGTPRPGAGHKSKAACPQFHKPRTPRETVALWHADYEDGLSFTGVERKHGCNRETARRLFIFYGLRVRTRARQWERRRADGSYLPATPLTDAQIDAALAHCTEMTLPDELKLEWRRWDLARRAWFIRRLRAQTKQPSKLPVGPYSANVEPFDYTSPRAHEVMARRNVGRDSRTKLVRLRLGSEGVIWDGWLWFWVPNTGYVRGPWALGESRPMLHHHIWERAHGRDVPRGHAVRCADGNYNNLEPANLILVTRDDLCRRNQAATLKKKSAAQFNAILSRATRNLTQAIADHANTNEADILQQIQASAHRRRPRAGASGKRSRA